MSTQRYSVTPHPIETILTWVKSGEIAGGDKTSEMYSYHMGLPAAGDCGPPVGTGATAVAGTGRSAPGPHCLTSEQKKRAVWSLAHTRPQPFVPTRGPQSPAATFCPLLWTRIIRGLRPRPGVDHFIPDDFLEERRQLPAFKIKQWFQVL